MAEVLTFCEIALWRMSLDPTDDKPDVDPNNGLVPTQNKPLPEPVLTQLYVVMWH